VSLVIVELRAAKASKHEQKALWEFYLENTNHIKMDDQNPNVKIFPKRHILGRVPEFLKIVNLRLSLYIFPKMKGISVFQI